SARGRARGSPTWREGPTSRAPATGRGRGPGWPAHPPPVRVLRYSLSACSVLRRSMYASPGVTPRRPITVLATSANLSNRYRFAPESVTHANDATHPDAGAVAAHIAPVCTTAPVMIRVQIANLAWS